MVSFLRKLLFPPFPGDESEVQAARFLNALLWISLLFAAVFTAELLARPPPREILLGRLLPNCVFLVVGPFFLWALRRGHVRRVAVINLLLFLVPTAVQNLRNTDIREAGHGVYVTVAVLAGLLLGELGALVFGGMGLLLLFARAALQARGVHRPEALSEASPTDALVTHCATLIITTLFVTLAMRSRRKAFESARRSAAELAALNAELERRVAERTAALERSNAELEQFAYVASHDLQEPLRMISSYTQLLARRYQGRLDADADEFLGYVVDAARRMSELIKALLEYARVGREEQLSAVEAQSALDAALANLHVALEERGAQVRYDPLPRVHGNEVMLTRLFQNLIGNGLKFAREDTPARIHVSAAPREGGEWLFSIRDNGIGIPKEAAGRLFALFQRLHGRDEYPGTGIGLATCKKIVEHHGGRIWVESTPGEGSTFYFTLKAVP